MLINDNCSDMFELFCLMAFNLKLEALSGKYGSECDAWSLGVVLYAMSSGQLLLGG